MSYLFTLPCRHSGDRWLCKLRFGLEVTTSGSLYSLVRSLGSLLQNLGSGADVNRIGDDDPWFRRRRWFVARWMIVSLDVDAGNTGYWTGHLDPP
jgi:hypothetical protein